MKQADGPPRAWVAIEQPAIHIQCWPHLLRCNWRASPTSARGHVRAWHRRVRCVCCTPG